MRASSSYCGVSPLKREVHGPVHSLQFLHYLTHTKQQLLRVFSQLHLYHVEINGETSALLESADLVELNELDPCLGDRLFRIYDIERDSLA